MELRHLLDSALTRPSSADARLLKSIHPFVPAAQHLISSFDNNKIRAAWRTVEDHQWNAEWLDNPTRLRIFIPDTGTHTHGVTLPRTALTPSAPMSVVSAPVCTNGVLPPLRPVSVAQKNKPSTMLSSMSNPSTSSWTARPDGSGRWDHRMAAQHLPRDLVRPSSDYEELAQKKKMWFVIE